MQHCSLIGLSVWIVIVPRFPSHPSPSTVFCISTQGAREDIESLVSELYHVLSPLFEESHKDFWNYIFRQRLPSWRLQHHGLGYWSDTTSRALHLTNTEMTSVKDIKPRIPKFLQSQAKDKHAEHFFGAWVSTSRTDHAYTWISEGQNLA